MGKRFLFCCGVCCFMLVSAFATSEKVELPQEGHTSLEDVLSPVQEAPDESGKSPQEGHTSLSNVSTWFRNYFSTQPAAKFPQSATSENVKLPQEGRTWRTLCGTPFRILYTKLSSVVTQLAAKFSQSATSEVKLPQEGHTLLSNVSTWFRNYFSTQPAAKFSQSATSENVKPEEERTSLGDVLGPVQEAQDESVELPQEERTSLGDVLSPVQEAQDESVELPQEGHTSLEDVLSSVQEAPDENVKSPEEERTQALKKIEFYVSATRCITQISDEDRDIVLGVAERIIAGEDHIQQDKVYSIVENVATKIGGFLKGMNLSLTYTKDGDNESFTSEFTLNSRKHCVSVLNDDVVICEPPITF